MKDQVKNIDKIIEETTQVFSLERDGQLRSYKAFYISSDILAGQGIKVLDGNSRRPILLLGGTSIPISDRKEFISFILKSGYEMATIENPIGGPFDIKINPKIERPDSLRDFLEFLIESGAVDSIDIAAQSYSAFEVIRVLLEDQVRYQGFVKSIILINPPGLNENTGFFRHSFRFFWHHMLKGYIKIIKAKSGSGYPPFEKGDPQEKEFVKKEAQGIKTWFLKTFRNVVRTLREIDDIVTFRIKEPLMILQSEYNYDINIFLSTEDQILPVEISLKQIKDLIPSRKIKLVPGGHNDLFFQHWQRGAFLEFVKDIRNRKTIGRLGSDLENRI